MTLSLNLHLSRSFKLPLKSSFFVCLFVFINLLTLWRSLFRESNPRTLPHQGWTKNPAYPEPSQTSKNQLLVKVVNGLESLTIFAKSCMSDSRLDSEYTLWPRHVCLWTETHRVNILIYVAQLFIENIVPDFEKPSIKDMISKRIPYCSNSGKEESVRYVLTQQ